MIFQRRQQVPYAELTVSQCHRVTEPAVAELAIRQHAERPIGQLGTRFRVKEVVGVHEDAVDRIDGIRALRHHLEIDGTASSICQQVIR